METRISNVGGYDLGCDARTTRTVYHSGASANNSLAKPCAKWIARGWGARAKSRYPPCEGLYGICAKTGRRDTKNCYQIVTRWLPAEYGCDEVEGATVLGLEGSRPLPDGKCRGGCIASAKN